MEQQGFTKRFLPNHLLLGWNLGSISPAGVILYPLKSVGYNWLGNAVFAPVVSRYL
jgi:hypothetical protein